MLLRDHIFINNVRIFCIHHLKLMESLYK